MSRRFIPVALTATVALALSACGSSEEPADDTTDEQALTIEHAFGSTEIPADATDVVTLGWGSTEAALALGVVPVGIEAQTYAVDENGLLPWVNEALGEVEAEPTILPATVEEPAYEDIDALDPDLILAPYSGITEEQYEILGEIAPTVVYPEEPWTTPWRDVVSIVGESLGMTQEAEELVTELDATLEETAAAHPELSGVTVAAIWDVGGTFYVYKPADSRVDFLLDLGLESAPSVEELDSGGESFVYSLSYEQTDQLEADVVVNYASTEEEVETFLSQSYAQAIPAVQDGAIANITGDQLIAAMSPPTALSIDWGLEDYVEAISAAVDQVG
ncbi:iron complex transport system substrate-binding protein [Georgenia satyanarayanai]|uniref:Iron complex transport system substrate-binding protein n=1 Tax=Georgenia satyanarayanai TaxID=860221 RepID=A0A2Y9A1K7_9MICO|nr:iron-siderophore ABC transporter substrate-binding protein [Georgenia satyanarayanai]PYG01569.1 iron complex transport system substrate-binding protein [Georgenia satyanarayanai]SSA36369.1 iron complex transport system substrate-binding protein [Georgenia satyanarayanai]